MVSLTFDLRRFALAVAANTVMAAASIGLYRFGEAIMTDAKERTPVDTGALRNSGHVMQPEMVGRTIVVRLRFGGPAAPYAPLVHEDLTMPHRVGTAKFLELAMLAGEQRFPAFMGGVFK